jgi:hypothetical protein
MRSRDHHSFEPGAEDRAVVVPAWGREPEVATASSGDLARERQTDPQAVHLRGIPRGVGLRPASGEEVPTRDDPRPGVHHRQVQCPAVVEDLDLHPRGRVVAAERRCDCVVDEVPEHGRHVPGLGDRPLHQRLRADPEQDAALGRLDALRAEERLQVRLGQPIGVLHRVVQRAALLHIGQVRPRPVGLARVEQARDRVEAVRELVPLGTQGGAHRTDRVEPPGEGLDVGPVPQHGDPSQVASVAVDRADVDEQHPVAGDDRRAGGDGRGTVEQVRQRCRQGQRPQCAPDRPGQVEQARGFGVAGRHGPRRRDRDHTLAHAAEDGLLVLHEGHEVLRLQPEGEPDEASTEQHRRDHREQHRDESRPDDGHAVLDERVVHAGPVEPDAHLADDGQRTGGAARRRPAGCGRADRHLRPRRLTQGAACPGHGLAAVECLVRRGAHHLPDPVGVRVGESDPAVVRDHDEQRSRALLGRARRLLDRPVRECVSVEGGAVDAEPGDLGAEVLLRRHALRDREGRPLRRPFEAADLDPDEHGARQRDDRDHDEELQQEHLGGEAEPWAP